MRGVSDIEPESLDGPSEEKVADSLRVPESLDEFETAAPADSLNVKESLVPTNILTVSVSVAESLAEP